ncbi:TIGR03086 family metal-binding protein [Streptomyces sp. NPDC006173]|uniref:TIGR03086 family metal-binding protein n=1 Tax=Streptomyces sp. NPDC006173 TaxID=3155349 RepID=UPI0033CCF2F4
MDVNKHNNSLGELLDISVARAVPVVVALTDADLDRPTPCSEYDVKGLLNHLLHVMVEFQKLAAKEESDFTKTPDRVGSGPDWRERFAAEARALAAAWSRPGAEDGLTGAMNMPARLVGSMALLDVTVHAWDLAQATGQQYPDDADLALVVAQLDLSVAELGDTARSMGMFGTAVEVPAHTPPLVRLIAATGRDPYATARHTT